MVQNKMTKSSISLKKTRKTYAYRIWYNGILKGIGYAKEKRIRPYAYAIVMTMQREGMVDMCPNL